QADLYPRPSPALGGSPYRPAGREGALRAQRHQCRARGGDRRRGDGAADARAVRAREGRGRLDGRGPRLDGPLAGAARDAAAAVGKRVASRHGATFVDLDAEIEQEAGARIPDVFASEGEAGFRRRERAAIEGLGPADSGARLTRVIAPGGGAIVDPRNRWHLF